jgi:ADP-ribosyl-[dinitrogen reductase] hydrolase
MPRTSISDPLQIGEVRVRSGYGSIGITFCPGKKDRHAATGAWDRDLDTDIKAIAAWNAAAVISLIEDHEFKLLQVERLGEVVTAHRMEWLHLPIVDVSTPCAKFEDAWRTSGEVVRKRLRDGLNVVVHCRGGLGRAGMVAARLLVELGVPAKEAILRVRRARPGAIETPEQKQHVRSCARLDETGAPGSA